jgi:hypothetical protein
MPAVDQPYSLFYHLFTHATFAVEMLHSNRAIRLGAALNSRETLQMAAEAAGVGTWDLAVLKNELHSSPRCKEIFGVAADARFQYEDFLTALPGTGLGLWLSLEIMKKCGSSLKVKSALGQGTVFHISLIGALPDNHRKHGALDLDAGNELRRRAITQRPGAVTSPEFTPSETQL